jgi:hypothetical protein
LALRCHALTIPGLSPKFCCIPQTRFGPVTTATIVSSGCQNPLAIQIVFRMITVVGHLRSSSKILLRPVILGKSG